MNPMQEQLKLLADKLELRIEIGYAATLSDGRVILCQARFPDFGNSLGNLIFAFDDKINIDDRRTLVAQGYGISTLSESRSHQPFNVGSCIKMFSDWEWSGPADQRPSWMIDIPDDEE